MVDTKQTKTIGEHHVASELARRGWAPALTRDGLERTDILAVHVGAASRRQIEVQVKTARGNANNERAARLANEFAAAAAALGAHVIYTQQVLDWESLSDRQRRWETPDGLCATGTWRGVGTDAPSATDHESTPGHLIVADRCAR